LTPKAALNSDIYLAIDKLVDLPVIRTLVTTKLTAPQIITLAMESHGKSTTVERLVGLPLFPRDTQRCTSCPIRVKLRRVPTSDLARVALVNRQSKNVIQQTDVAVENTSVVVREYMQRALQIESMNKQEILISMEHEVIVTIHSPVVPNLDIIDLFSGF
jgi:hypothetical protein